MKWQGCGCLDQCRQELGWPPVGAWQLGGLPKKNLDPRIRFVVLAPDFAGRVGIPTVSRKRKWDGPWSFWNTLKRE
jgi:hypothetical protein